MEDSRHSWGGEGHHHESKGLSASRHSTRCDPSPHPALFPHGSKTPEPDHLPPSRRLEESALGKLTTKGPRGKT